MSDDLILADAEALAARIPDGIQICVPKDTSGVAMEVTRALVRRNLRDIHLVVLPQSGLQADLLIGAGAVRVIEAAGVTLSEFGPAPCFTRAVKAGAIGLKDATCPAIYAALQAGEKGIPFMPLRGLVGSDLVRWREDWKVIANPFDIDDPIVALPAIRPDVALFHAPMADRYGNVWIGVQRDLMTMAHAAHATYATVEEIVDFDLMADPLRAAGTIPSLYLTGIAVAKQGAWPIGLAGHNGRDADHMALYAELAASEDGLAGYVGEFVNGVRTEAE